MDEGGSDKSRAVALALGGVLGIFGAHRYYLGKVGTGILQTCSFGGLGVWWLYDMILLAFGSFRDVEGRRVKYWTELGEDDGPRERSRVGRSDAVMEELYALREEVAELAERVDYTERLLTEGRHRLGDRPADLPPGEYTPT